MIYHQFQASARKSNLYSIHTTKELGMRITLLEPMNTIVSLLPWLANPSSLMIIAIFFDTLIPNVASPLVWGCIYNLGDWSYWVVPKKVELLSCGREGLMVVSGCGEKIDSEDGQRIRFERGEFFFFLGFMYYRVLVKKKSIFFL